MRYSRFQIGFELSDLAIYALAFAIGVAEAFFLHQSRADVRLNTDNDCRHVISAAMSTQLARASILTPR